MASKIPWTEQTWNPVSGCTKISAGCLNCYAERMAKRLQAMGQERYRNEFKVTLHREALDEPFHWKKPRKIFVCSMGDLFHEKVPFDFIDRVMAVITLCHWHTFQILTKREKTMFEYFNQPDLWTYHVPNAMNEFWRHKGIREPLLDYIYFNGAESIGGHPGRECKLEANTEIIHNPLPNIWLGVSVENEKNLHRLNDLIQIPTTLRVVSLEPLLSDIYISDYLKYLQWVIIGAESIGGHPGRECKLEWVRDLVGQCNAASVPVFIKQLHIGGKLNKNINEWPKDLQLQEWPKQITFFKE